MKKFTLFLCMHVNFIIEECRGWKNRCVHRRSADEFKNQYENSVEQGGNKNALGGLVAVGVDIKGENNGVGQEGNAADGGEQGFVCS
jgi:hypothetical protein